MALSLLGCTSSDDPGGDASSAIVGATTSLADAGAPNSGTPATYGGAPLGTAPCYVDLPGEWQEAVAGGKLWSGIVSIGNGGPTPEGTGVFVSSDLGVAPSRFTIQGAGQRVVEQVGTVDNPTGQGQYSYSSIDAHHVVFAYEFTMGEQQADQWAIYAGDRRTGELTEVARNPVDAHGAALPSVWVRPVLTDDYIYWVQATPDRTAWGGNELMQYSFATGATRVVYHGMALGFVPFGSMILFGALAPDAPPPPTVGGLLEFPEVVRAVDQATGEPVEAPPGLDFAKYNPDSVATNGDMVVWSTPKGEIRAWRAVWGRSIVLIPGFGEWPLTFDPGVSTVDDPQLYGHFLVWRGGWVLDLMTNSFASLTTAGSSVGPTVSGDWLAWWDLGPGASNPAPPGGNPYTQYLINLKGLPDLPGCPEAGGSPASSPTP